MQYINDKDGLQWEITIDLNAIERVHSMLDIDLCDTGKDSAVFNLLEDLPLCGKTLYAICKPAADAKKMELRDFNVKFSSGEVLVEAAKKIWKELQDFFPPSRRRAFAADTARLIAASDQAYQMADDLIESGKLDEELQRRVKRANEKIQSILSGDKSIDSLESLAEIQDL